MELLFVGAALVSTVSAAGIAYFQPHWAIELAVKQNPKVLFCCAYLQQSFREPVNLFAVEASQQAQSTSQNSFARLLNISSLTSLTRRASVTGHIQANYTTVIDDLSSWWKDMFSNPLLFTTQKPSTVVSDVSNPIEPTDADDENPNDPTETINTEIFESTDSTQTNTYNPTSAEFWTSISNSLYGKLYGKSVVPAVDSQSVIDSNSDPVHNISRSQSPSNYNPTTTEFWTSVSSSASTIYRKLSLTTSNDKKKLISSEANISENKPASDKQSAPAEQEDSLLKSNSLSESVQTAPETTFHQPMENSWWYQNIPQQIANQTTAIQNSISNLNISSLNPLQSWVTPGETEGDDGIRKWPPQRTTSLRSLAVQEDLPSDAPGCKLFKGRKVVALSIDDSPSEYTEDILKILKQYNAKATFFIIGSQVELYDGPIKAQENVPKPRSRSTSPTSHHKLDLRARSRLSIQTPSPVPQPLDNFTQGRDLLTQMLREGHELGNHTFYDRPSIRLDRTTFEDELLRMEQMIFDAYASVFSISAANAAFRSPEDVTATKWFRPGGGFFNDTILTIAEKHGYRTALGCVFPHDPHVTNAMVNAWHVLRGCHPGAVIVLHDARERILETLKIVLPELLLRGYDVVTLSGLVAEARDLSDIDK
ncbi:hypothetical protein HK096_005181, partial [Nowakowskiella sp. JEL0078]